jgi:kynureninase
MPVDVQKLNTDFACGGVLKWPCGGPGVGFYVRPDLGNKLVPRLTGWMGHQHPFDFEIGPNRYTDPPFRFMNGTPHIPALEAARPGIAIITEAGVANIREKSKRQTARLMELADQHGWHVNTPRDPERRGGTVSIDMPDSQAVSQELIRREILVDWRPQAGVRFSPHFYTKDEEIDLAIAAVDEIVKERCSLSITGPLVTELSVSGVILMQLRTCILPVPLLVVDDHPFRRLH